MRYPDGGGLTAAGRARREKVRLQAAQLFEQDMPPMQMAHQLRVSTKSAYQWRRCWRAGGAAALTSRDAGGAVCRLSPAQLARLRAELDKGPAVHGWDQDQRWTLERVATLTGRLFHVRYTLRGTSYLLRRNGVHPACPRPPRSRARRGRHRSLAGCDLGEASRRAAATGAYLSFEDEAGQTLRPPRARTWARHGRTPVITVSGKGSGRVSAAGMTCCRPGARNRFFYWIRVHTGRKDIPGA